MKAEECEEGVMRIYRGSLKQGCCFNFGTGRGILGIYNHVIVGLIC